MVNNVRPCATSTRAPLRVTEERRHERTGARADGLAGGLAGGGSLHMSTRWLVTCATWLVALTLSITTRPVSAQDAQQRQAAAAAFDRGTTAYLQQDYATAARWFETANDLAPAAGALLQAIRAHERAANELRAASLALRLIEQFGEDARAATAAQEVLEELAPKFLRIEVDCERLCDRRGRCAAEPPVFFLAARYGPRGLCGLRYGLAARNGAG